MEVFRWKKDLVEVLPMEEGPGGTASSKDRRYPQVLVVASAFAPPLPPAPLLDCKP